MFKVDNETDLNQISLTGVRSLALIGLLVIKPRSLNEIREEFIKFGIMEKTHSDDILRIDLNTVKNMGCKISRASSKTDFKYVLTSHPFNIPFTDNDVKLLKRVYEKMKSDCDIPQLLEYDMLFKKLAENSSEEKIKQALLGISVLKHYDTNIIRELITDCENKQLLEVLYKKATSREPKTKNIVAQKLVLKSDKVYLYGYDINKKDSVILNALGIQSIESRKTYSNKEEQKTLDIKFYIKDFGIDSPTAEETILKINNNGYLVEGKYFNEFVAIQRILSLGPKCTVKEPESFRNKIISILKEMKDTYEKR